MMSRIIKKTLNEKETIKKYFSVSNNYIKLRLAVALLKWLIIFMIISFFFFFIAQSQAPNNSGAEKARGDQLTQENYGIESNNLVFPMFNNEKISDQLLKTLTILALIFFLIILPFIILYNTFYIKISNEFVFTDRRVIVKKGWIETNVKTIYYNRITDISVKQSLLERIIKSGTISISTAGSDGYEAVLWHIDKPYELKKLLYETKIKNQEKQSSQHDKNKNDDENNE